MDAQRFDVSQRQRSVSPDGSRLASSIEDMLTAPPPTPTQGSSTPVETLKAPIFRAARLTLKLLPLAFPLLGRSRASSPVLYASSEENLVSSAEDDWSLSDSVPSFSVHPPFADAIMSPAGPPQWSHPLVSQDVPSDEELDIDPFVRPVTPEGDAASSVYSEISDNLIDPFTRPNTPELRVSSPERGAFGAFSFPSDPFALSAKAWSSRPTSPFLDPTEYLALSRPGSPFDYDSELRDLPYAAWLPEQDPTAVIDKLEIWVETQVEAFYDEPRA